MRAIGAERSVRSVRLWRRLASEQQVAMAGVRAAGVRGVQLLASPEYQNRSLFLGASRACFVMKLLSIKPGDHNIFNFSFKGTMLLLTLGGS